MHKVLCILVATVFIGACLPRPESTTVNFAGAENNVENPKNSDNTNEVNFSSNQNNRNIKAINVQDCRGSFYSGTAVDKKVTELVNSRQYDIVSIKTFYGAPCASATIFHRVQ